MSEAYNPSKDYYKILEVSDTSTAHEIKKSFRRLIKKNHTDKGGHLRENQELNKAYETLSNDKTRKEYDRLKKEYYTNNHFSSSKEQTYTNYSWTYNKEENKSKIEEKMVFTNLFFEQIKNKKNLGFGEFLLGAVSFGLDLITIYHQVKENQK